MKIEDKKALIRSPHRIWFLNFNPYREIDESSFSKNKKQIGFRIRQEFESRFSLLESEVQRNKPPL